ncbi:MAG: FecR family protein [Ginsengibacter sp.]
MDHQDYEIEDFVMDKSFQNCCLGKKEEDVLFWKSWIIRNPGKHKKIGQAARLFFLLNGNNNAHQFRRDEHAVRNALCKYLDLERDDNKLTPPPLITTYKKHNRRGIVFRYAGGIAASLLLIIMVFYFWNRRQHTALNKKFLSAKLTYTSMPGEKKSFQLPDGSTVLMNAGTTIEVAEDFNITDRAVSLKGEAYFKVTHIAGKPFIIHTNYINVKILGTEFNIKAYPEDKTTEAILIKGSVEVTLNDKYREKITLKPNDKLVIQNNLAPLRASNGNSITARKTIHGKIKMMPVSVNAMDSTGMETSWIENRLNFNDEILADVAIKLERWYGVKVSVDGDIAWKYKYTGIFENESIYDVLKALQRSPFFHYSVKDDNIFITK